MNVLKTHGILFNYNMLVKTNVALRECYKLLRQGLNPTIFNDEGVGGGPTDNNTGYALRR